MMKTKAFAAFAALAAMFGATGGAAAQPAAPLAAAFQAIQVTPSFLIGRWTDTGDCSNAVDFLPDGRFVTTAGAAGRWTLSGDRLSFIGQRTITAQIRATSRDAITLTHDDGSVGGSTRCATTRRAMPVLPSTIAEALRISRPARRDLLIGRWTDEGDCAVAIVFGRDGSFTVPTGNGRWTLVGERLTFIGQSTVGARVRAVGNDRILLIHDDGRIGQSVRC
jgi:hypothetical protein